jgi:hypothetical protein
LVGGSRGSLLLEEKFEYIGVCWRDSIKDPPKKMTNKWLVAHGWFFETEYEYWISPDII